MQSFKILTAWYRECLALGVSRRGLKLQCAFKEPCRIQQSDGRQSTWNNRLEEGEYGAGLNEGCSRLLAVDRIVWRCTCGLLVAAFITQVPRGKLRLHHSSSRASEREDAAHLLPPPAGAAAAGGGLCCELCAVPGCGFALATAPNSAHTGPLPRYL